MLYENPVSQISPNSFLRMMEIGNRGAEIGHLFFRRRNRGKKNMLPKDVKIVKKNLICQIFHPKKVLNVQLTFDTMINAFRFKA